MSERRFRLVMYRDDGDAGWVGAPSIVGRALAWAADQHLPAGCRYVDDCLDDHSTRTDDDVIALRAYLDDVTGRRHAPAQDGGDGRRTVSGDDPPTVMTLPDDDERLWGDGQDPGEAFRCGLVWTGVRPLCALMARVLVRERAEEGHAGISGEGEEARGWDPRRIVELGAGMGVNGIVAAQLLPSAPDARSLVVVTDVHAAVLDLLRLNVRMNREAWRRCRARLPRDAAGCGGREGGGCGARGGVPVLVRRLAWGDDDAADDVKRLTADDADEDVRMEDAGAGRGDDAPSVNAATPVPFDLVVAADIVYNSHVVDPLLRTVERLLRGAAPGARFIMAHTLRRRLIPPGAVPASILGGGRGVCSGDPEKVPPSEPPRDEHLDLFLFEAKARGFSVVELGVEDRRPGEELVHLFDVRPPVEPRRASHSASDAAAYDVYALE